MEEFSMRHMQGQEIDKLFYLIAFKGQQQIHLELQTQIPRARNRET